MSDASWSPPLDVNTRTITTLSIIRARPEHIQAIHKIQLLAYPGRTDFHESEDVFRSKLEAYPAGNFVALATYSVVTDDDTSTWTQPEVVHEDKEQLDEEMKPVGSPGITVVEIEINEATTQTSSTTTTSTTPSTNPALLDAHVTIVRAQTPDIVEGSDDDEDNHARSHPSAHAPISLAHGSDSSSSSISHDQQGQVEDDQEDEEEAILFQWEKPVGYIFSHPYSRETVTLHHVSNKADHQHDGHSSTHTNTKRVRLDNKHGDDQDTPSSSSSSEDPFEHDPWMEKYFVHDCAIDPEWQGKGVASRLWKALEESLIPAKDGEGTGGRGDGGASEGNIVDTEEEESELSSEGESQQQHRSRHRHRGRGKQHRSKRSHYHRKGAPNLKEILLVSVQGTKPFWQRAGGFEVIQDHDIDLSVYGNEAFLMSKPFYF
ncbi:hypothetical protein CPB97_003488 [Podila verticillata]|nr:hypothetical protein CPB97_003488 [Podila verticillata]